MTKKKIKINFKCYPLNGKIPGYSKGSEIYINCDDKGVPLDSYWYRRFLDSKIDNCIEFVNEKPSRKFKKPLKDSSDE